MNLRTVETRGSGLTAVPRRTINPSVNELLLSTQIPIGRRRKKSKKKTSHLDTAGSDGDGDDETYHKNARKVSSTSTVSTTQSLNKPADTTEIVRGATHLTPSGSHVTIMERENPYVMGTGITLGRLSITPPHLSMVYSSESNDNDDDDEYESLFGQTYNDTNGLLQRLSGLARDSQTPYYATSPPDDMFASSISSASSIDYDPALATSAVTDNATATATNEDDTNVATNTNTSDTNGVTTIRNNTVPVLATSAGTAVPSTNNNFPGTMSAAASSRALSRLPKRRTSLLSFSSKNSSSSRQVTCACPIPVSDHPLSEFGDDSEFGDESDAPSLGFPRTESFASFTDDDDMSGVDYVYPKKAASIASHDSGSVVGTATADDGTLSTADAEAASAAAAVATTSTSTRSKLVSNITKSFKAFSNAASKFSTSQQAQVSSNSALFAFSPRSTDECMVMTDELNQAAAAAAADNAGCTHEEAATATSTSTASPRNIPLKTYNYSSTLLPVVRPREHRMNPDFLRVYASEALMRQRGKLDPDFVGRATMLLPPRTDNPDSFYRLKAGIDGEWEKVFGIRKRFVTKFDDKRCITTQKQVPARWVPINWDDCENCEGDVDEDALETSVTHET
ncbi:hypothetical protein B0I72DRAFT_139519 [Yarrowia lipolytica]|jgi:hypothetical protein|uniref:Uncharacterized protein n=1 Tax=Yarrowia lipolytica TaxID=4952 RepID=A0A371CBF3_YARLL|nr:Hypothetical protein YALI2_E00966g [Yarrowia lipolytica]RDW27626.1 hypothetical protein B0I71DRAFT_128883 [Yarrowia lipolytica]RDW31619.1 hypothetical protein B0I72DRAFT_139519 [Yarrowia lipolytica]RDW37080.1 hypothetical protein B0I73DRAFT_136059 [Yarrowia lipolytica]RDW44275.1 hypothetical protein B0I74DRAFT_140719 [Yarrowia lipolytica]